MARADVQMDYEVVAAAANRFRQGAQTLNTISRALQAAMRLLEVTAFVGLVGGAAVQAYLNAIQPRIEEMAQKCEELATDLDNAIRIVRDGDETVRSTFL